MKPHCNKNNVLAACNINAATCHAANCRAARLHAARNHPTVTFTQVQCFQPLFKAKQHKEPL